MMNKAFFDLLVEWDTGVWGTTTLRGLAEGLGEVQRDCSNREMFNISDEATEEITHRVLQWKDAVGAGVLPQRNLGAVWLALRPMWRNGQLVNPPIVTWNYSIVVMALGASSTDFNRSSMIGLEEKLCQHRWIQQIEFHTRDDESALWI